ncbi:hypothetical protein CMUS01_16435 [Colletotrichum musicola]|uniref:Uncharacterized protein n=1 Tax=Colletotrichum musicola TaxID=2175873 RepID=A0A8H6INM2_9PEZI|nr:hypothetical protein CMUS01_16435 [Colletotrichum musicola]
MHRRCQRDDQVRDEYGEAGCTD